MDEQDWAQGRREAAAEHARRLVARKDAEAERAQAMIDAFLATAERDAVPPEPLVVRGRKGGQAKSGLMGWYLKTDRSVAVATDGHFYVMTADLGLVERMRGYRPKPVQPPLIVGEGGGDGETIDMDAALARHLRH
ncbi:hypothetical protein FH969_04315 [Miniimonas arenae]|uniref:Uncharacterized protein n=1 Tax=Miniimonas arenae TaxID=676201 RepID=A0A5C5BCZ0_9MICO|nr:MULTISPECIES: hypothetical protein [Miniimonas]TNU76166.1 hypothetical protein FH969_04315 [Miniimonas arenae]